MIPEISTRGEEVAVAQNSDKFLPKIEQLEIVEKTTTESVLRPKGDRPFGPRAKNSKNLKFGVADLE